MDALAQMSDGKRRFGAQIGLLERRGGGGGALELVEREGDLLAYDTLTTRARPALAARVARASARAGSSPTLARRLGGVGGGRIGRLGLLLLRRPRRARRRPRLPRELWEDFLDDRLEGAVGAHVVYWVGAEVLLALGAEGGVAEVAHDARAAERVQALDDRARLVEVAHAQSADEVLVEDARLEGQRASLALRGDLRRIVGVVVLLHRQPARRRRALGSAAPGKGTGSRAAGSYSRL